MEAKGRAETGTHVISAAQTHEPVEASTNQGADAD